jgi:hypothetical protein
MSYTATKQHVFNRGTPPDDFLDQLVAWGKQTTDDIFAPNDSSDIYSSIFNTLGPWQGIPHRRAVMLEVLRVLAGFESSWNWNEGVDKGSKEKKNPQTTEAGAWQVSANSMAFGQELKDLVRAHLDTLDGNAFQRGMKSDHPLAMEYISRLLRRTTKANGPVLRHEIDPWLRKDAVAEFQELVTDTGTASDALKVVPPSRTLDTPDGREEIEKMFGNPANNDGTLNEAWEGANIRKIAPPDKWQLYYQDDTAGLVPVSGIRMHTLLEDVFVAALDDIWNRAGQTIGGSPTDDAVRAWLHSNCLDQHGGGFNFRPITGGSNLSLHAYGIAIDWDPDHNPRKKPLTKTLPDWWYDIWANHGWTDGRHFATPDPMHVQFATGA